MLSANSRLCSGNAIGLHARFTTRWRRYVGISVQLEVLTELLRHNKVDAATKTMDTTRTHVREGLAEARQSIWAAVAGLGRKDVAGAIEACHRES